MISIEPALRVCTRLSEADITDWTAALIGPMNGAGINTPKRIAAFIGQCVYESGGFTHLEENLNYRADRLHAVWPSRFPTIASCLPYEHNPEALANYVYANRLGNGDEASGDGWRFRGRGIIQLTGRWNYDRYGRSRGMSAEAAADSMATRAGSADAAAWFWRSKCLNTDADGWKLTLMTTHINGGSEGLAERKRLCNAALNALA